MYCHGYLLVTEDSDCVSTGVLAGAIVASSLLHTAVLVGVVIVTCLWMRRKRSVHRGLLSQHNYNSDDVSLPALTQTEI